MWSKLAWVILISMGIAVLLLMFGDRLDFWFTAVVLGYLLYMWIKDRTDHDEDIVMSNIHTQYVVRSGYVSAVSSAEINNETAEILQRVGEKQTGMLSFAETEQLLAERLAQLVISGELDKTPAIKIGLGGMSGEAYQRKKAILDAELDRLQQPAYRTLDASSRPVLKER